MVLSLICQTQEQQMQAHKQQTRARLDMAVHQVEDCGNMRELLRRTTGNLTSGEGTARAPAPAAEVDRPLIIFLLKMTPRDDVEAFLEMFESTAEACGWPHAQWVVRFLPLLTGKGLSTADGLPAADRLSYLELCMINVGINGSIIGSAEGTSGLQRVFPI